MGGRLLQGWATAASRQDRPVLLHDGTIFAMRLANDTDRGHITSAASDNLKGLFEMLPVLRTGEAIITAEIDLALGSALRPDGTDVWASRRPELYGPLFAETPPLHDHPRAA